MHLLKLNKQRFNKFFLAQPLKKKNILKNLYLLI